MSLWSRIANTLRGEKLNREIDEELESHIQQAIENGRDPIDTRKAFGSLLRHREESRDVRLVAWLDSIRADTIFGWRQLRKNKIASAAAILSLALAIGACTSAFRLIDALLLRPLPIATPDRLYVIEYGSLDPTGKFRTYDSTIYPMFRQLRAAVRDQAELIAVSYADRTDLTYGSDDEMEKAHRQYVSGWSFNSFGLQPAIGRLFTENDDLKPKVHPYAVLSFDYWTRRFGQDSKVIGRTFRIGNDLYEIVGVAPERFTGTETGVSVDIFLPTMMHPWVTFSDASWFRTMVLLKPGSNPEVIREKLKSPFQAFQEERAKNFIGKVPQQEVDSFLKQTLRLEPAAAGRSDMQKNYRDSLLVLGVMVALVLLIACANVANLMTVQAASRAREMALRVSIGAGKWRLIQLVLIESAWLASLAAIIGALFAWWSAPFVVSLINPPDNPARLYLPADWRVLGFGVALAFGVTLLFGLAPALNASAIKPASVLKGGDDPHSKRRLMHVLIAAQVAFCFLVHFSAGLFVATFDRLSNQPTGFSSERLIALETVTRQPQSIALWNQVTEHLRTMRGIENVSLSGWPLLDGGSWGSSIYINGSPTDNTQTYFLSISPGWFDTMKIALIDGRDFRAGDTFPGAAIVNEAFVKHYFNGENPIGKRFEKSQEGDHPHLQIVGVVRDARYRNMREPIAPIVYVPFQFIDNKGTLRPASWGAFIVRTTDPEPQKLSSILREEVRRARPEFRVSNIRTQNEINQRHTIRERLLATLAMFFAIVALVVSSIGLYGVLDFAVLQRRREIGIRMALGAQASHVARCVTGDTFAMVLVGALIGIAMGVSSQQYLGSLLYGVKATDLSMFALPSITILAVAFLAAVRPVIRAVRVDPIAMLRVE